MGINIALQTLGICCPNSCANKQLILVELTTGILETTWDKKKEKGSI